MEREREGVRVRRQGGREREGVRVSERECGRLVSERECGCDSREAELGFSIYIRGILTWALG